ncbi:MAG: hypothetical protein ACR2P8_06995 [Myxococcota bacterium]
MHLPNHLHHLRFPVFYVAHSPHVEWHEITHPIRAALITLTAIATFVVGGVVVESAREAAARVTTSAPAMVDVQHRPLAREWRRWGPPSVDTRSMYRPGAEVRSVDHMWRKR